MWPQCALRVSVSPGRKVLQSDRLASPAGSFGRCLIRHSACKLFIDFLGFRKGTDEKQSSESEWVSMVTMCFSSCHSGIKT